jgi:C-8 sterol isomerase
MSLLGVFKSMVEDPEGRVSLVRYLSKVKESITNPQPVFDSDVLKDVVKDCLGDMKISKGNHRNLLDGLTQKLADKYPYQVNTSQRYWITNQTGNAIGQLAILHASLNEYLIFWNTPLPTSGHSGQWNAVVRDIMVTGEMGCAILGGEKADTKRHVYRPGDMAVLTEGQVKVYDTSRDAIMLEYARGNIPSMLPLAFLEAFTSTWDMKSVRDTLEHYGGHTMMKLLTGRIQIR